MKQKIVHAFAYSKQYLLKAVLVEETSDSWVGHGPPVVVVASEEASEDGDLRVTWKFVFWTCRSKLRQYGYDISRKVVGVQHGCIGLLLDSSLQNVKRFCSKRIVHVC